MKTPSQIIRERIQEYKEILKNLKNRTTSDYDFTGSTQRTFDKGQIDILENILPLIEEYEANSVERLLEDIG